MSSSGAEFTVSWSETLKTLDHGMLMCKWTPCSASLWNTPCIYLNTSHPLRSDNHAKPYCDFIFILLNCSALNNTPLLFTWLEDSFIHSFISIAQTLWDKLFAQSSGFERLYLNQWCPDTADRKTWEGAEGLWEIDEESCVILKSWKRVVVSETDGWSRWKRWKKQSRRGEIVALREPLCVWDT